MGGSSANALTEAAGRVCSPDLCRRALEEGLAETLTLHRLGVFSELGTSFKTTNLLEHVMAQLERKTQQVDRWRTSDQKFRWCAAALLAVEPHFRRVKGFAHLPLLECALAPKILSSDFGTHPGGRGAQRGVHRPNTPLRFHT